MDAKPMRPMRTYEVTVYGYAGVLYSARSPAKARWRAYMEFSGVYQSTTFHEFLVRSTIRVVPNPPGVGDRILVSGKPALRAFGYGQGHYVHFMWEDGDTVLVSHPLDVKSVAVPHPDR